MPKQLNSEAQNTRLGFLATESFDNGASIRGGILITDTDTKPFEFRITSPVRPTAFQRALYGNTLEDYINLDLIGVPLIAALQESLELVIVLTAPMLRIRPKIPIPVALLSSTSTPLLKRGQAEGGGAAMVSITTHWNFPTEEQVVRSLVTPILNQRDLFEPFERIKVALAEAHRQRVGDTPK
jgi:hypothetical protein